ncbi:MAG: type II toxin-antitoxin system HicA family toxin [Clostridiales bacterium]|nr:type II toxin-antitoxin system HicA family toxin [Clostridiales bacterium]
MTKADKAKARIQSVPKDYTYTEARQLLKQLGFIEYQKGKTSGSRVLFYRESDNIKILLHKPHPGDVMSVATTRDLYEKLVELGEL